jgi:hypothetical protein
MRALALALLAGLLSTAATASELRLTMAALPNNGHVYQHSLLKDALAAAGVTLTVTLVELPPPRVTQELETGDVDAHAFLQTPARDRQFVPIPVRLTDGLIGRRVFLIRAADQARFDDLNTVADLQRSGLVGAFGRGWFDVTIWRHNGLAVQELPANANIHGMVGIGTRGVDYFSRGATEILAEAARNPDVAIEQRLIVAYPNDLIFYLNPKRRADAPAIEAALTAFATSGEIGRRAGTQWRADIERLRLNDRRVITLAAPQ